MPWRVTISTLLIALILLLLAVATSHQEDRSLRSVGGGPLESDERFPINELDRIDFVRGNSNWTFAREDDTWWQVTPFRAPVQEGYLLALAERANDLFVIDRFASSEELTDASLSLDPPKASLVFAWPDGSRRFSMGRRGVGGRGYLQIDEGSMTLIVHQGLHELVLESDPATWRESTVFPGFDIESGRVSRFVGDQEMRLERMNGQWRISQPISTRVNMEALEAYVIELARAKTSGVILDEPDSLSAFGLENPIAVIEVEDSEGSARKLLIGDRVGGRTQDRYVMIDGIPSILRLDSKTVAGLLGEPLNLVDPRASGVSRSGVKAIMIHGPDEDIRIERDLDRWVATTHAGVEVPRDRVESLLDLILLAPAMEVALVDTYPKELEAGTITLVGYDQRPLDTVRVLREKPEDGERWGFENGDLVVRIHSAAMTVPLRSADWGLRTNKP